MKIMNQKRLLFFCVAVTERNHHTAVCRNLVENVDSSAVDDAYALHGNVHVQQLLDDGIGTLCRQFLVQLGITRLTVGIAGYDDIPLVFLCHLHYLLQVLQLSSVVQLMTTNLEEDGYLRSLHNRLCLNRRRSILILLAFHIVDPILESLV